MKYLFLVFLSFSSNLLFAQPPKGYADSIKRYRAKYVAEHEAVKPDDKKYFDFYEPSAAFAMNANFEELKAKPEVKFKTSAGWAQRYLLYGKLHFNYKKKPYTLCVYFSPSEALEEKYRNHLFIPFTDETNGEETYGGGRYVDILTTDIKNGKVMLDFNKNYNPYCAYGSGWSCPIPPAENALAFKVKAGEKKFKKAH